jgi:hypothetical protein
VDGKKNKKVSLHMRTSLPTRCTYGTCTWAAAATGAPVAGWTYRTQVGANGTLAADAAGNATRGKSARFNADPAESYSVNVHVAAPTNGLAAGTIMACGDLTAGTASAKSKATMPRPPKAKGPKP